MKAFRRMVRAGNFLIDKESLAAYSYDGSGLEGEPGAVLKPFFEEELRRIIVHAKQHRLPLIPRGSGTGLRGGTVKAGGIIIDMRGFNTITLDKQRNTADVGAGVTIGKLQQALKKENLSFPLGFAKKNATVGGLASTNTMAEESFGYGDWTEVVERVEAFDGLGRLNKIPPTRAIGKEGTTNIITKLRLKLIKKRALSLKIKRGNRKELIKEIEELNQKNQNIIAIEYLDKKGAGLLGYGAEPCLITITKNEKGGCGDTEKAELFLKARRELPYLLWKEGFGREQEFMVDEKTAPLLIKWCEEEEIVCYGHLGAGVLITTPKNGEERRKILNHGLAAGATPGGKHGYGRILTGYVPEKVKREIKKEKEERDYNHILNPGVIV